VTPINQLKVPFGTAKFCRLRNARYLTWRDAFEVEFEDGIAFLEAHRTIRKVNNIRRNALPVRVKVERSLRSGFFVHYNNGQRAEDRGHSSANCRRRSDQHRSSIRNGADGNRATSTDKPERARRPGGHAINAGKEERIRRARRRALRKGVML